MRRLGCAWSVSIVAFAVAQLAYSPAGYAQAPQVGEPGVHAPDDDDNNVAPSAPDDAPPAPAPVARRRVVGPVVTVYATTPKASLQAQSGLEWRDVCTAPCNIAVDPDRIYRIGGATIQPSDGFRMPRSSGRIILDVHHGSTIKRNVGLGLIIGGLVNCLGGGFYLAKADDLSKNDPNNGPDFYKGVGVGSIIHGAIVAIVGATFALSSTSVEAR